MIDRIFEFALRQRVFVLMGALALIAAGVWSALRLPIDAVPDITNVQVQINTTVSALSPEEVERQVSFPIETEMTGLPGLEEVRSLSKFGLSQVTMVFSEQTDIYRARQLVSERLQMVLGELPAGAQPKLAPISTGLGEIFFYTLDYATNLSATAVTRRSISTSSQNQDLSLAPGFSPVKTVRENDSAASAASRPNEAVKTASHPAPARDTGLKPGANESSTGSLAANPETRNPKPENDQSLLTSAATKSHQEQLLELRTLHDTVVKPAFRSVPGVADIETCGGYEKQIVIQPNPHKLFAAGLSFEELASVIRENVENAGGGVLNKGGEQVTVRTLGRVQSLHEIAGLPVKFGAGAQPILVKDVAEVGIGSAFRTGAGTANGREAIVAYLLMMTGENSRLVAQRANEKLADIQSKLPPGVVLQELYNRSDLVNRTITTVRNNLLEGAVLVMAVLFALLGNWRAAFIVASAIPLSMLFAVMGMVRFGVSGNLMSLGAVDFGLIVDGAVVIAENAVRLIGLRQRSLGRALSPVERRETVLESCRQVGSPMVFGVVIITIVYVPILALAGTAGKMFHPMAITVMLALIGSLLLALTLIPALCAWFLGSEKGEGRGQKFEHGPGSAPSPLTSHLDIEDTWLMRGFKRVYRPVLLWGLRHRLALVMVTVLVLGGAVFLFQRLGAEFVPQLDEGSLVVQIVGPTSVSLDTSVATQLRAERIILDEFPEIATVFSRIGTPEIGTDPMGANLSDTFLSFAPPERWRKENGRTISKDELIERITATLQAKVPGQQYLFTQPIEMRFNEMLEGARSDIAVKIYGEEFTELQRIARETREILEKIPGTAEVELDSDNLGTAPVLEVILDREAMRRYNLRARDVNGAVATALGGLTVGLFVEGNRRHEIVVRMSEAQRGRLEDLKLLPVRVQEAGLLPLGKVSRVIVRDQVNMIEREGGRRRAGVEVNLRGRDIQSWVNEAKEKLEAISLPQAYHIEFGGQFEQLLEARARLAFIVPLALLLIFMLIFAAFGSLRQAALVFLCVPLAVTGGVAALWLRALPFSISAAIGFIALSGIAVLNGLMILSFINQLRAEGRPLREAVLEGSLTRLRPKLMTALVASLGFVPMAIATGAGAEVQRPLATVVIGGIISSTFLTLVLLPVLYEWMEGRSAKSQAPTSKETSSLKHQEP